MKLIKLLVLSVLFMGYSINSTQMPTPSPQAPAINIDMTILGVLYKTYDEYQDHFVSFLPEDVSLDKYRQVLRAEQERLKTEMNSVSYKSVLFSFKSMATMGAFLGVAGLEYGAMSPRVYKYLDKKFGEDLAYFIMNNVSKGLYTLQALAGLSFARDIKEIESKKKSISEQYDKCTKMLALFEGQR